VAWHGMLWGGPAIFVVAALSHASPLLPALNTLKPSISPSPAKAWP
jgi:hypothetical protein